MDSKCFQHNLPKLESYGHTSPETTLNCMFAQTPERARDSPLAIDSRTSPAYIQPAEVHTYGESWNGSHSLEESPSQTNGMHPDRIHSSLLRFLISAGLSFQLVENNQFREFAKALRLEGHVPGVDKLTRLFEEEYERVRSQASNEVAHAKNVCILSHAVPDAYGDSNVQFMLSTPKLIFAGLQLLTNEKYSMEYIASLIARIGAEKISAVVLDRVEAQAKELPAKVSRREGPCYSTLQEKYPYIIFSYSVTDSLRMLIRRLFRLPKLQELLEEMRCILEYLARNHDLEVVPLRCFDMGRSDACDWSQNDLWKQCRNYLSSLLSARETIGALIPEMIEGMQLLVSRSAFWDNARDFLSLFNIFHEKLQRFEAKQLYLYEVPVLIEDLRSSIDEIIKNSSLDAITKGTISMYADYSLRFASDDPFLMATLLHPLYLKKLNGEQVVTGMKALYNYVKTLQNFNLISVGAAEVMRLFALYKSDQEPFTAFSQLATQMEPLVWWRGFFSESAPALVQVAERLLQIPCCCGYRAKFTTSHSYIRSLRDESIANVEKKLKVWWSLS